MEILKTGAVILFLVLVVINWIIYHKIFDVYYFGGVMKGCLSELVGCVLAAAFEIAIIYCIGKWLLGLLIGVGKWFLKTLIVLAVVFVVLILIFVIINNIKKLKEIKSFDQKYKNEPADRSTINSLEDNIIQPDNVESTHVSECINIENKNEFISSQIKYKENQEKIICPECGSELLGRNFCTECGTRIRRDTSTPVSDQSNNENLIIEKIAKERAEQEYIEEYRINRAEENKQNVAGIYKSEKKVENEGKTMAILSLICGILSLATMGAYFVLGILGIVFACLGKKQGKMRGQAIAGLVCSILSLVIIIGMVIVAIISPSESDDDSRNNTSEDTEISVVDEELEEPEIIDTDENKEEVVESEPQEKVDDNENVNTDGYEFDDWWMYNIIPYSSYESGGEDLHLYMNLVWNKDGSIDLYGFAYSYDEPVEEYETMVHLTPDSEYESYYVSDYRNFFVGILDSYIAIASDGDEMGHAFQGDFSLVSDGSVVFTGDYVEVLYGEIPNFFRDTANVYSTFRCNLYYTGYESYFGQGYHFLHYIDETGTQITFIMESKPDDSKFFYADLVTVTGVYTDQYDPKADIVLENISIELFNN